MATKPAPRKAAAQADGAEASAAPAKSGAMRMIVLSLLLLTAGAGGAWFYFQNSDAQATTAKPEPKKNPVFVPLDQFTVNLASTDMDRFLQIGVTFEVASDAVAVELKRQMPVVRGRILMLLASKTAASISTVEGKKTLMSELLAEARALLPAEPVQAVAEVPAEAPKVESDPSAPKPKKAAPIQKRGVETVHFSSFVIQ